MQMVRLGLCCKFMEEPIKFKTITATYINKLTHTERLLKLSALCLSNAQALQQAVGYCITNGIGCFRVNSQILPLKTHPQFGYDIVDLPDGKIIEEQFIQLGKYAKENNLRFSFHPDQFILLSSPRNDVTQKSIDDLEYQAQVSEWIGADVINIHGGGAYGDKLAALKRLGRTLDQLSKRVRSRLTLENDDRVYTPEDLLPVCEKNVIPLVYDVHHHRCLLDGLTVDQATEKALGTWDREPLFHMSSPREGWSSKTPQHHHDYIDINDFPDSWYNRTLTVEIEAKAKELAVKRLRKQLFKIGVSAHG